MKYVEDILLNLKEDLLEATTNDDIIRALNNFFEIANAREIPMGIQWNLVGCMLDQYRRGEL